jgi:hypothetical protein
MTLVTMARDVIDGNWYMTLGTVEPDGLPRLSPVFFTHDGYRTFYWVSQTTARHSGNIAREPRISMVIFDSTMLPGTGEATYLTATAKQVPTGELAAECAVAFRAVRGGVEPFTPAELSEPEPLRLYRADVTGAAVHVRGGHPEFGTGIDARVSIGVNDLIAVT